MANITILNTTVITPGIVSYVPLEIWLVMVALTMCFFFHALLGKTNTDITAVISVVMTGATAWLSGFIDLHTVHTVPLNTSTPGEIGVVPVSYIVSPTWFSLLMLGFFFVSIVLVYRNVYLMHLTRRPQWKQERYK